MKSKTNPENDSHLRIPRAKNKLGLRIPRIALPHDDLIVPEKPIFDIVPPISEIPVNFDEHKLTGTTGTTGTTGITGITYHHPVSPVKDFTKTPNSITRLVLAQGLFRGKSKQIYDYLWSSSRGAINPERVLRKTHKEIQKGSGIGSRNTILDGLKHLQSIGLLKFNSAVGEAFGNEYEIFTPEELGYTGITGTTGTTGTTELSQKLVIPVIPETGITGITQTIENKDSYSDAKTSFKDFKYIDDEAFAAMLKILNEATEKISGKKPDKFQKEHWKELAELLVTELEMAAALAKNVSNVPAFLTEHLRRRLQRKKLSAEISTEIEKGNVPQVEKTETFKVESYEAEPLTEQGRQTVLKTFREYLERGQSEFVMSFEETYTPEDWRFLMKETEKK